MSKRSRKWRAKTRAGSRTEPKLQLTDEQWLLIADLFPEEPPSEKGGRPRCAARECFEGILWVLRTGARWKDLPAHFPSPPACWRRFQAWTETGLWKKAWARLLRKLDRRGRIHWGEAMADGTFCSAKKGANALARPNAAREPKSWSSATAAVFLSGAEIVSASPHEVTLIEPLVEQRILPKKPRRLLYDAAADSDPLRKRLWPRGIELVCVMAPKNWTT